MRPGFLGKARAHSNCRSRVGNSLFVMSLVSCLSCAWPYRRSQVKYFDNRTLFRQPTSKGHILHYFLTTALCSFKSGRSCIAIIGGVLGFWCSRVRVFTIIPKCVISVAETAIPPPKTSNVIWMAAYIDAVHKGLTTQSGAEANLHVCMYFIVVISIRIQTPRY